MTNGGKAKFSFWVMENILSFFDKTKVRIPNLTEQVGKFKKNKTGKRDLLICTRNFKIGHWLFNCVSSSKSVDHEQRDIVTRYNKITFDFLLVDNLKHIYIRAQPVLTKKLSHFFYWKFTKRHQLMFFCGRSVFVVKVSLFQVQGSVEQLGFATWIQLFQLVTKG